jgi:phosphoglycerate kinase
MRLMKDADLSGKRVLLRTSLNLPILADGNVGDTYRLTRALPTIELLAGQGAKMILVGYLGRAGASLKPVAAALQKLIPAIKVSFTDSPIEKAAAEIAALQPGECLMLENMRCNPGEETNDPALSAQLAALADLFVDDAFAEAHRAYADNVGVARLLPSYAGLLMEEEVMRLSQALTPPPGALALIGGAKFETKQPLLEKLLGLYPRVLLGGALGSDMLKARGLPIGQSYVSDGIVPEVLAGDERIEVPEQILVESAEGLRVAHVTDIRADEATVDLGPDNAARWAQDVHAASFILWNGPLGIYEKGHTAATDLLARAVADASVPAVLGGGDTAAALAKFTFDPARVFVSTGGGAMLEFLANGGSLPAIDVLKQ